jgi:hypothetical protein
LRSHRSCCLGLLLAAGGASAQPAGGPLFHDSHVHLTNFVQEGPSAARLLEIMADRVGRAALFERILAFARGELNPSHLEIVEAMLLDPTLGHVHFDISRDEAAKHALATPERIEATDALLNRHSDRFLFGTDKVAPPDQDAYLRAYSPWDPIWKRLTPEASRPRHEATRGIPRLHQASTGAHEIATLPRIALTPLSAPVHTAASPSR